MHSTTVRVEVGCVTHHKCLVTTGMASDDVFAARYQLLCHAGNAAALPALLDTWLAAHPTSEAAALCELQQCGDDAGRAVSVVQRVEHSGVVWRAAAGLALVGRADAWLLGKVLERSLVNRRLQVVLGWSCTSHITQQQPITNNLSQDANGSVVRSILHALLLSHGTAAVHTLSRRLLSIPTLACDALLCIADVHADIAAARVPVTGGPDTQHDAAGTGDITTSHHVANHVVNPDDTVSSDEDGEDDNDDAWRSSPPISRDVALRWEAKALRCAVDTYGQHQPRVWLRVMAAHAAQGRGTGPVYQRALKTLQGSAADDFVQLATIASRYGDGDVSQTSD